MPRQSKGPRYYPSRNCWVANLNGERIKLVEGPRKATEKEAQEKYALLVKSRSAEQEGDRAECWVVLNAYLRNSQNRVVPAPLAPNTFKMHKYAIDSFVRDYGTIKVRDLRQTHFQEWLAKNRDGERKCPITGQKTRWGDSTIKLNLSVLVTAFAWAASDGQLIGESPFQKKGMRAPWPDIQSRSKRLATTAEEYQALLAQADRRRDKTWLVLMKCLWATGARPAELYLATADEWDDAIQGFCIDPGDKKNIGRLKTRRHLLKSGKKRIVRLPDELVPEVKELMGRRPKGPLFLSEHHKVWNSMLFADRFKTMVKAANRRTKKIVVRPEITCYSIRHAFITRWIVAGKDVMVLCELLNTSLKMVQATYSHLFEMHDVLLDSLNRFSAGPQGRGPQTGSTEDGPVS